MSFRFWSVSPEWTGAACFIVAGGPSVALQNLELLRGRNIIAIKSSWRRVPWAQFLFTAEPRWWMKNGAALDEFKGCIVGVWQDSASVPPPDRRAWLRKTRAPGLPMSADTAMVRRTSVTGALCLAAHLGVRAIVTLGLDGRVADDGRTHHSDPHPLKDGCFVDQREDLAAMVAPLRARGISVINASPGSALGDLWPVMPLDDALRVVGDDAAIDLDRLRSA